MYQFASYFTSYLTIISTSIYDLWILLNFLRNILHVYHFQSEKNNILILCFKFQRFFPSFICTIFKYFPFRVHQYTVNQLFFVTTLFRNLLPKNWFAMKPYSRRQGSYEPCKISRMWIKVGLQYIYILKYQKVEHPLGRRCIAAEAIRG